MTGEGMIKVIWLAIAVAITLLCASWWLSLDAREANVEHYLSIVAGWVLAQVALAVLMASFTSDYRRGRL